MKVTPQIPTRRILNNKTTAKSIRCAAFEIHSKERSGGRAQQPPAGRRLPMSHSQCPAARPHGRPPPAAPFPRRAVPPGSAPLCPALSCPVLPARPDPRPTARPSVGAAEYAGFWPARRDRGDARSGRVPGRPPPFAGLLKLLQHGERQTRRGHPRPGPARPAASLRSAERVPTAPSAASAGGASPSSPFPRGSGLAGPERRRSRSRRGRLQPTRPRLPLRPPRFRLVPAAGAEAAAAPAPPRSGATPRSAPGPAGRRGRRRLGAAGGAVPCL